MEEVMAYCVKEKTQKPMKDAQEVTLKNDKHALKGICASCGTKMTKFISVKNRNPQPEPAPTGSEPPAEQPPSEPHMSGPSM